MKNLSKPQNAKQKFGVTIKVNRDLDNVSKQILFPEKVEKINKLVSGLTLKN